MVESKTFIKFDAGISVAFIAYYLISQTIFDASYSDGYKSVSTFFLLMNVAGVILHGGLIYFDFVQNKMMVISMRGGCIAFFIGMAITVLRLGIFSIQFIILFCAAVGLHLYLLLQSSKMKERP